MIVSDDNFASIHVNSDHDKYFFEIYFVGLTHFSVFLSDRKLGQLVKMFSGVFSTGATGALAPVILEQSITVNAL